MYCSVPRDRRSSWELLEGLPSWKYRAVSLRQCHQSIFPNLNCCLWSVMSQLIWPRNTCRRENLTLTGFFVIVITADWPYSKETLTAILTCKSVFDTLEPQELNKARTRSNPFESIKGGFFLNRAAMKMANMDAVFDFMFTRYDTVTAFSLPIK